MQSMNQTSDVEQAKSWRRVAERLEQEKTALQSALSSRDAEKWQPIETAPKDGEWQLVARFNGEGAMLWWLRAQWHLKRGYWRTSGGACEPTHWLRVPLELQAPELQEEKGEASKND